MFSVAALCEYSLAWVVKRTPHPDLSPAYEIASGVVEDIYSISSGGMYLRRSHPFVEKSLVFPVFTIFYFDNKRDPFFFKHLAC